MNTTVPKQTDVKIGGGGGDSEKRWKAHPNPIKNFLMRLSFPLLKKIVGFALKSERFQYELFKDVQQKESKGIKTFLNRQQGWNREWSEFFQTKDFAQLQTLIERMTLHLDELSKEVALRFFYTRLLTHLEGIISLSGFQKSLAPLFPLDWNEQKRLVCLDESFTPKLFFPKDCEIPNIHIATQFGMSCFVPEIQRTLIGRDVIDGGGYSGDSAMVFTEFQPRNVYAFEPNPEMFPEMKKIITNNTNILGDNVHKIVTVPMALGKVKGSMKLFSKGAYDGSTSIHQRGKSNSKEYDVPVVSIDDFVREHSLDVGLIKLDVEGAESDVIEGALRTITTQHPLLIISIYHTPKDFFEIKPKIEGLNLGYRFLMRHFCPQWSTSEFCLLGYPE